MRKRWKHTPPDQTQECPRDNTSAYIQRQVMEWLVYHTPVHPESALEIAAWWQAASNPGITTFASSGTVTDSLLDEVKAERMNLLAQDVDTSDQVLELDALIAYLGNIPGRE